MLLTVDPDADLMDIEGIAIAPVPSLQAAGVDSAELDVPKAVRFATDGYAPFGQEIFDIAVTEIESIVQPDRIGNDIGRKSMTLV
jgi:hypothetical protein